VSDEMRGMKRIHWPAMVDAMLIYGGALVIVLVVTFMAADPFVRSGGTKRLEIAIVGLGLLANQIGVWHIASNLLSGRRYLALREEVDEFIRLVRGMNTAVLAGDRPTVDELTTRMHKSVDRMVSLAGREGEPDDLRQSLP